MDEPDWPDDWRQALAGELERPYFAALQVFVAAERFAGNVFPPAPLVYTALQATPLNDVRVVILGQDPYHGAGQAHGLSFSVPDGVPKPPSLRNIFRELQDDLGIPISRNGNLIPWAQQGVLLLNTVLTVREGKAGSHQKKGWEQFTDAVLRTVNALPRPVVFMLWGNHARAKAGMIDARHLILQSAHPSPLSAHQGFFGCRPFSKANAFMRGAGQPEINWRLGEHG